MLMTGWRLLEHALSVLACVCIIYSVTGPVLSTTSSKQRRKTYESASTYSIVSTVTFQRLHLQEEAETEQFLKPSSTLVHRQNKFISLESTVVFLAVWWHSNKCNRIHSRLPTPILNSNCVNCWATARSLFGRHVKWPFNALFLVYHHLD